MDAEKLGIEMQLDEQPIANANAVDSDLGADTQREDGIERAVRVLEDLLNRCGGIVSSIQLCRDLEKEGLEPRETLKELKYYFDEPEEARWHHHGRSFYSRKKYQKLQEEKEEKANLAEMQSSALDTSVELSEERPKRRQEEARLGSYIVSTLENIYQSDYGPSDAPYVFDVHNGRAGTHYENVDLLSVHWRSDHVVELVTVEVSSTSPAFLFNRRRTIADSRTGFGSLCRYLVQRSMRRNGSATKTSFSSSTL